MLRIIGLLVAGNALGQVSQLAAQPLLARLYPAEEFGRLGQVLAVAAVLAAFGTLQMHTALVVSKEREPALRMLAAGGAASILTSAVSVVALAAFGGAVFGASPSIEMALACGSQLLWLAWGNLVRGWLTGTGRFRALSLGALARALVVVSSQAGLGLAGVKGGLLWGAVLGEAAGLLVFAAMGGLPTPRDLRHFVRPREVLAVLSSERAFSVHGTVQEVAAVVFMSAPVYLFTRQYSATLGGEYAMANRLVWAPIALIGASMAQVYYHRFSREHEKALAYSPLLRWGAPQASIAAIGLGAAAIAPVLMSALLGPKWEQAPQMSRWIVLWGTAFVVSIPHRACIRVLRLQHAQLWVDSVAVALTAVAFTMSSTLAPMTMMRCVAAIGIVQSATLVFVVSGYLRSGRCGSASAT